jgi:hypothetical protein
VVFCLLTGVGRHSDPEVGPVLHDAIHNLLNDELKLATTLPKARRRRLAPALPHRRSASTDSRDVTGRTIRTQHDQRDPQSSAGSGPKFWHGRKGVPSDEYEYLGGVGSVRGGGVRAGARSDAAQSRRRAGSMADAGSLIIRRDTLAEWLASRKGLLKSDLLR